MPEQHKILSLNAFDQAQAGHLCPDIRALIERRYRTIGSGSPLFYREPLHLVRGSGLWLYDAEGRRYLDAYNNVASVGHCHPHVAGAIARQAATLAINSRYLYDVLYDYTDKLLATMPADLSRVALTCSGSESSDLALRIARYHTGGAGIIVSAFAYHGNTTAVAEISPSSGSAVPVGLNVRTIPAPDLLRHPTKDLAARFAADMRAAIADLDRHGIRLAGFICDSIFSSDGVFTEPPGFLAEAVAVVREAGGLYIADEVQPGFGRSGAGMWGFQRHNVVPDIVVMGKPMGNDYPVAGVAVRAEVLQDFARDCGYFNTFGGNAVAAAAGLAVLEVIEAEGLLANAAQMGALLKSELTALKTRFPVIGDVRGAGLFVGVEFCEPDGLMPAPRVASRVVNGLRDRGVLIGAAGPYGNVLKIRPPLCIGEAEIAILVEAIGSVLAEEG